MSKSLDDLIKRFAAGDFSFIQPEHVKAMAQELILLRGLHNPSQLGSQLPGYRSGQIAGAVAGKGGPQSWNTPVADLPTGREEAEIAHAVDVSARLTVPDIAPHCNNCGYEDGRCICPQPIDEGDD